MTRVSLFQNCRYLRHLGLSGVLFCVGIAAAAPINNPTDAEASRINRIARTSGEAAAISTITSRFGALAGSYGNISNLVAGLHSGTEFTLTSPSGHSVNIRTGGIGLSYGDIFKILSDAGEQLGEKNLSRPTLVQFNEALFRSASVAHLVELSEQRVGYDYTARSQGELTRANGARTPAEANNAISVMDDKNSTLVSKPALDSAKTSTTATLQSYTHLVPERLTVDQSVTSVPQVIQAAPLAVRQYSVPQQWNPSVAITSNLLEGSAATLATSTIAGATVAIVPNQDFIVKRNVQALSAPLANVLFDRNVASVVSVKPNVGSSGQSPSTGAGTSIAPIATVPFLTPAIIQALSVSANQNTNIGVFTISPNLLQNLVITQ